MVIFHVLGSKPRKNYSKEVKEVSRVPVSGRGKFTANTDYLFEKKRERDKERDKYLLSGKTSEASKKAKNKVDSISEPEEYSYYEIALGKDGHGRTQFLYENEKRKRGMIR